VFVEGKNFDMKEKDDNAHGCLCFLLGMFFGPIGLIVAAIIGKARGVVSALFGMAALTILIVLFLVLTGALGALSMQREERVIVGFAPPNYLTIKPFNPQTI